jgi:hypothetical protein
MMRIHSDTLTFAGVFNAMNVAGVWATTLELKGSRKRDHAFEVKLSGDSPFRQNGGSEMAATWDQWGIFLAYLYSRDPDMIAQYYAKSKMPELQSSKAIFEYATGNRFDDLTLQQSHRRHRWEPILTEEGRGTCTSICECGAVQRWDHVPTPEPRVMSVPATEKSSNVQLWTDDADREWFNNMTERVRARRQA